MYVLSHCSPVFVIELWRAGCGRPGDAYVQGRACISARESITYSLTLSLMGWWRRVGIPCFSFNERCGRREGRRVTGRTRRAAPPPGRGRPPHSCLKPAESSACLRRGRCCRPSRRVHSTGRDRLLADDRLGRPQQQPHRYQWCTECGNSLLAPCTLLHSVAP